MKVLIQNTFYLPLHHGGAAQSVRYLARGLKELGLEVSIVAARKPDEPDYDEVDGTPVYYLEYKNLYWPFEGNHPSWKKIFWHAIDSYNLAMSKGFGEVLERVRPDLLHTNNLTVFSPSIIAKAKQHRIPIVHSLRDYSILCPKANMFRADENCDSICGGCTPYALAKKIQLHDIEAVVGGSRYILDKHIKLGAFKNTSIKTVVHNPVKIKASSHITSRLNTAKLTIGFIGLINKSKGIEWLIEELINSDVKTWKLNIAGKIDSDYAQNLSKKYQSHKQIEFLGFKTPDQFYPSVDLVVVPSLWHDTFPRVVIESFGYGKPVIGSNRGGIPEVIMESKNGFLFDPDVKGNFINKLKYFEENSKTSSKLSEGALNTAKNFTLPVISQQYFEVYKNALDRLSSKN